MKSCCYLLHVNIFHVSGLSYCLSCECGRSRLVDNNWIVCTLWDHQMVRSSGFTAQWVLTLVKTFWSFFPRRKLFLNIGIFFVHLIHKMPTFFLSVTVQTQENIAPKKVREENILKFANTQRVNIHSKTFWSCGVFREEISLDVSIFQGILMSNKWTRGTFFREYITTLKF